MVAPKQPLVSVCIPVFNGENFIHQALESCLLQTYHNLEIVILDNASTDGTADIVHRYQEKDERVRYFKNDSTIPIMRNIMKSFEYAKGEFVQHLGHDDWLSRRYVENAVKLFQEHTIIGAVMPRIYSFIVAKDGSLRMNIDVTIREGRYSTQFILRSICDTPIAGTSILSMMRRTDVLSAEPFLEELYREPRYGRLYEEAQGTDWIVLLHTLLRYEYFAFSNDCVFIKLNHTANAGLSLGQSSLTAQWLFEYRLRIRSCLIPFFQKYYQDLLSNIRTTIGSQVCVDMVFGIVKSRCAQGFWRGFDLRTIQSFFAGYSMPEAGMVFWNTLQLLTRRAVRVLLRKKISNPSLRDPAAFFLSPEYTFQSDYLTNSTSAIR